MNYIKSESNIRPVEVEAISGSRFFIRKNIEEKTKTDDEGNTTTYYTYNEAIASEAEFAAFSAAEVIKIRHENEIIDTYTLQLIEQGAL